MNRWAVLGGLTTVQKLIQPPLYPRSRDLRKTDGIGNGGKGSRIRDLKISGGMGGVVNRWAVFGGLTTEFSSDTVTSCRTQPCF